MKTTQQIVDETLKAFANLTAVDLWEMCDGCYAGISANNGLFDPAGYEALVNKHIDAQLGGNEFNYEFGEIGVELIQANLVDLAKYYLEELDNLQERYVQNDEESLQTLANLKQSIKNIL